MSSTKHKKIKRCQGWLTLVGVHVLQQVGERVGGRVEVDVGQGGSAHRAPHVREKSGPHHVREERRRAAEKVDGHRSGHFRESDFPPSGHHKERKGMTRVVCCFFPAFFSQKKMLSLFSLSL